MFPANLNIKMHLCKASGNRQPGFRSRDSLSWKSLEVFNVSYFLNLKVIKYSNKSMAVIIVVGSRIGERLKCGWSTRHPSLHRSIVGCNASGEPSTWFSLEALMELETLDVSRYKQYWDT